MRMSECIHKSNNVTVMMYYIVFPTKYKQVDTFVRLIHRERNIVHYASICDVAGESAYSGLLLFKMLLVGIWNMV